MIMKGHEGDGSVRLDVARAAILKCQSMLSELKYPVDDGEKRIDLVIKFLLPPFQKQEPKKSATTTIQAYNREPRPMDEKLAEPFREHMPLDTKTTKIEEVCPDPTNCIASLISSLELDRRLECCQGATDPSWPFLSKPASWVGCTASRAAKLDAGFLR